MTDNTPASPNTSETGTSSPLPGTEVGVPTEPKSPNTYAAVATQCREMAKFLERAAELVEQGHASEALKTINLVNSDFQSGPLQELKAEIARRNKAIAHAQRASSLARTLTEADFEAAQLQIPSFLLRK